MIERSFPLLPHPFVPDMLIGCHLLQVFVCVDIYMGTLEPLGSIKEKPGTEITYTSGITWPAGLECLFLHLSSISILWFQKGAGFLLTSLHALHTTPCIGVFAKSAENQKSRRPSAACETEDVLLATLQPSGFSSQVLSFTCAAAL